MNTIAKPKILVVEDEPHLAFSLKFNLEAEGYDVEVASTGRLALEKFAAHPDLSLVILDVMLPELNGFEVAKVIRAKAPRLGILMLTARTGDEDRVTGFEAGADDYLAKPFNLQELILRVRRMSQRANYFKSDQTLAAPNVIRAGSFELDTEQLVLTTAKETFTLTALEVNILAEFMAHPNRVLSREHLLQKVWGISSEVETRTVDNFIVRLRRYLEEDPQHPRYLVSVRGRGYRFVAE